MSSIFDAIRSLFPDFGKARRGRNEIRKRYRDNIYALDRGDGVHPLSNQDYDIEYLGNRAEKKSTHADHLIKKYSSQSDPYSYEITSNEEEVKKAMMEVVKTITQINYLNLAIESVFIVFVVLSLTLAVFLGIAGIGTVITDIGNLL